MTTKQFGPYDVRRQREDVPFDAHDPATDCRALYRIDDQTRTGLWRANPQPRAISR